jgi:hypothetical protein
MAEFIASGGQMSLMVAVDVSVASLRTLPLSWLLPPAPSPALCAAHAGPCLANAECTVSCKQQICLSVRLRCCPLPPPPPWQFTASNGDPSSPSSLHHVRTSDPSYRNQYQKVISSIGDILMVRSQSCGLPQYQVCIGCVSTRGRACFCCPLPLPKLCAEPPTCSPQLVCVRGGGGVVDWCWGRGWEKS